VKVKINSQEKCENNVVNINLTITEDDGTLVFTGIRPFVSNTTDEQTALAELYEGFTNIYTSEKNRRDAVLSDVVSEMVNQEISL